MPLTLNAASDDDGRRLDRILRKALKELPLSAIHRLVRKGLVLVNGKKAAPSRIVRAGETITVRLAQEGRAINAAPLPSRPPEKKEEHPPQAIREVPVPIRTGPAPAALKPRDIIFEGAGILVINKARGIEVHGRGSLTETVLARLLPITPPSLSFRPGPLHRLDKPSSGLIAFSTNMEGARLFSALLRERKLRKFYLALVEGAVEKEEIWRDHLTRPGGQKKTLLAQTERTGSAEPEASPPPAREAVTKVKPLAAAASSTLILAEIETGRTHQIRAQAAAHGHPLLYDRKYGAQPRPNSGAEAAFLLHAWRMEFPETPAFPHALEAPLPDYFREEILTLYGKAVPDTLNAVRH